MSRPFFAHKTSAERASIHRFLSMLTETRGRTLFLKKTLRQAQCPRFLRGLSLSKPLRHFDPSTRTDCKQGSATDVWSLSGAETRSLSSRKAYRNDIARCEKASLIAPLAMRGRYPAAISTRPCLLERRNHREDIRRGRSRFRPLRRGRDSPCRLRPGTDQMETLPAVVKALDRIT